MANQKISELTSGTPTTSDTWVMVQWWVNKKFTFWSLPIPTAVQTQLDNKVDKVPWKGLSTNDYDNTEKAKVDWAVQTIVAWTNVTVSRVWNSVTINSTWWGGGWGAVDSVNWETWVVTLNQDEIPDGTTFKQFSLVNKENIAINSVTGLISGWVVTINAVDNTKFDVWAFVAQFVDHSTQTVTRVTSAGFTGLTPTVFGTISDVVILSNGTISTQDGVTPKDTRTKIVLCRLGIPTGTTIIDIFNKKQVAFDMALSVRNTLDIISPIFNYNGNVYSPNWVNLKLNKTSGIVNIEGSNFSNDIENPNNLTIGTQSALSFRYVYRNGSWWATVWALTTDITPNVMDDGTGILTTVNPSEPYTIQRIYLTPNGLALIEPWQIGYKTLNEAKLALPSSSHVRTVARSSLARCGVVVKYNATALNTTDTLFLPADEMGKFGWWWSTSASSVDMQIVYNQSLVKPQIVTNATLWSIQKQNWEWAGTQTEQWLNWSWDVVLGISNEWDILQKQLSTPSTPASWYNKLYFKSDWKLYKLDSAWVETEIGAGGGGWTQMYEGNIDWQTFNWMIARFTVKAWQTIAWVKITGSSLPTWSNFKLDVRKNWTATTNSIFTSDLPVEITTWQSATNWVYITTKTTIDNWVCVADDVLYVFVTDAWSTLPLQDLYFLIY